MLARGAKRLSVQYARCSGFPTGSVEEAFRRRQPCPFARPLLLAGSANRLGRRGTRPVSSPIGKCPGPDPEHRDARQSGAPQSDRQRTRLVRRRSAVRSPVPERHTPDLSGGRAVLRHPRLAQLHLRRAAGETRHVTERMATRPNSQLALSFIPSRHQR